MATSAKKPKRRYSKPELTVRQARVMTYMCLGERTKKIAEILGVSDDSIRRDIDHLKSSGATSPVELELEKHKLLWGKALAVYMANLDEGNLQAATNVLKYTGVFRDTMEFVARLEPSAQQKVLLDNMNKLLGIEQAPKGPEPKQVQAELVEQEQVTVTSAEVVEVKSNEQEDKGQGHDDKALRTPGQDDVLLDQG